VYLAAPKEVQAYLAGIEQYAKLPSIFADTMFGLTGLLFFLLAFVGNILLGVAVWRSGTLPRWAGVLWAAANVLMYLSLVYGSTIGPASTPVTVPLGAVVVAISGAWMALSALSRLSAAQGVGTASAQPRVQ
jgi:hypothetical protein